MKKREVDLIALKERVDIFLNAFVDKKLHGKIKQSIDVLLERKDKTFIDSLNIILQIEDIMEFPGTAFELLLKDRISQVKK